MLRTSAASRISKPSILKQSLSAPSSQVTSSMKPLIIVAVGLPGSGKSWYFNQIGAHPISSDAIRLQLADDETDQTINTQVFDTVRYLLAQRIKLRRPVSFIDATNLTRRDRRPYI